MVAVIAQQVRLTVLDQQLYLLVGQPAPGGDEVGASDQRADQGLGLAPPIHPATRGPP